MLFLYILVIPGRIEKQTTNNQDIVHNFEEKMIEYSSFDLLNQLHLDQHELEFAFDFTNQTSSMTGSLFFI